jgi:hypothetical protein
MSNNTTGTRCGRSELAHRRRCRLLAPAQVRDMAIRLSPRVRYLAIRLSRHKRGLWLSTRRWEARSGRVFSSAPPQMSRHLSLRRRILCATDECAAHFEVRPPDGRYGGCPSDLAGFATRRCGVQIPTSPGSAMRALWKSACRLRGVVGCFSCSVANPSAERASTVQLVNALTLH